MGPPDQQLDAHLWTARATRYLVGVAVVMVMIASWKAATRWRTPDDKLRDRVEGDRGGQPGSPVPHDLTKPARSGARWTVEDDAYVTAHMDEPPEAIAYHLGRTPSAIVLRKATLKREGRG